MGMELGMGTTPHYAASPAAAAAATMAAPFGHGSAYSHSLPHHYHFYGGSGAEVADPMRVDEMLDLSSHLGAHDFFPGGSNGAAQGEQAPPPAAPSSSDHHGHGHHHSSSNSFNLSFADEFFVPVPREEAAELEWLSNFVDDSYPDTPNYPPAVQAAARNGARQEMLHNNNNPASTALPGRGARSKRSRAASAAAAAWHALVPRHQEHQRPSPSSSSSSSDQQQLVSSSKPARPKAELGSEEQGGVRRCTHCASEKTPQWRTGPLGPKTLCNACGVRYKSGRLVPEYRPAASPTFVLTQHSNSHRKVMELRRQNEQLVHIRGGAAAGSPSSGSAASGEHMFRDYGVC